MPITKCDNRKDPHAREKIVSEFEITPLSRTLLPEDKIYKGCCGPIETWVYTFSYQSKNDKNDSGLFHTGKDCGDNFLNLLGAARPERFSPFVEASKNKRKSMLSTSTAANSSTIRFTRLNQEIYDAINLLTVTYGPPDAGLQSLLEALASQPNINLTAGYVKFLNGVIYKRSNGKTLTSIIAELKKKYSNLRAFSFPLVNQILVKATLQKSLFP
jgi:hypothetical protein